MDSDMHIENEKSKKEQELEKYGVWVKSGPKDISEETEDTLDKETSFAESPLDQTSLDGNDSFSFDTLSEEQYAFDDTEDSPTSESAEQNFSETESNDFSMDDIQLDSSVFETQTEEADEFDGFSFPQEDPTFEDAIMNEETTEFDETETNEDSFSFSETTEDNIDASSAMPEIDSAIFEMDEPIFDEPETEPTGVFDDENLNTDTMHQIISNEEAVTDSLEDKSEEKSLLEKIALELSSLHSEFTSLKNEIESLKKDGVTLSASESESAINEAEESPIVQETENTGFYSTELEDESIALSGSELDNIIETAQFSEEEPVFNESIVEEEDKQTEETESEDTTESFETDSFDIQFDDGETIDFSDDMSEEAMTEPEPTNEESEPTDEQASTEIQPEEDDLCDIQFDDEPTIEQENDESGFFASDIEDESVALSGSELDDVLASANFSEEETESEETGFFSSDIEDESVALSGQELDNVLASTENNEETDDTNESGFFASDIEEESVALSGHELDDVLASANFSEEEPQDTMQNVSIDDDFSIDETEESVEEESTLDIDDIIEPDVSFSLSDTEEEDKLEDNASSAIEPEIFSTSDTKLEFENENLEEPELDNIQLPDTEDDFGDEIDIGLGDDIFVEADSAEDPIEPDFSHTNSAVSAEEESIVAEESIAEDGEEDSPFSFDDEIGFSTDTAVNEPSPTLSEDEFTDDQISIEDSLDDINMETEQEPEITEDVISYLQEEVPFNQLDDIKDEETDCDTPTETVFDSNQWDNDFVPSTLSDSDTDLNLDLNSEESNIILEEDEVTDSDNIEFSEEDSIEEEAADAFDEIIGDEEPHESLLQNASAVNEQLSKGIDFSQGVPQDLKFEIKSVLSYMDQLLESLPEDKITEFAQSEHFETYKKLFKELGLS